MPTGAYKLTDVETPKGAYSLSDIQHGPVSAEDFLPPDEQGSATGRFFSNLGAALNPVTAAEGVYAAVRHPIDTITNIVGQQVAQGKQAASDFGQGRYSEAVGHGLAAALPVLGPAAAAAGEQIGRGDVAGGLGSATGLLAPVVAPVALRGAKAALPASLKASIADSLAAKAAANVADVMTPKVGANKTRFAGLAEKVAPGIAADPELAGMWSRQGLHEGVQAKLAGAEQGLDAASDARLKTATIPTAPILEDLLKKKAALAAKAVNASESTAKTVSTTSPILDASGQPIVTTKSVAMPAGEDVIPAPNLARAKQLDQAIAEIKQLGPDARYDDLRTIRQAYDGPAKAVYNPSMTQDFLTAQGGKLGAADVTGTLREHLARMDPETAKANATYSLYRGADDVLKAVAETEKTRPAVGRKIIGRMTGTLVGEQAGGLGGAALGWLLGPAIDSLASADYTTKLKWAQAQSALAKAISAGDEGGTVAATFKLKNLLDVPSSAKLKKIIAGAAVPTSPTGAPPSTAPASAMSR